MQYDCWLNCYGGSSSVDFGFNCASATVDDKLNEPSYAMSNWSAKYPAQLYAS